MSASSPEDRGIDPPEGPDEDYREYGRQLAMDALLELALSSPKGETLTPRSAPRGKKPALRRTAWLAAAAAVCVIAAVSPFAFRMLRQADLPIIARNDVKSPPPAAPDRPPKSAPDSVVSPGRALADWTISPTGNAQFRVIAEHRIRLDRGELHVAPRQTSNRQPLVVETDLGTATADQEAEFLIGSHQPSAAKGNSIPMFAPMTRVLVLAGIVTLATPAGMTTGESGHLLAAEPDKVPTDFAVEASNGFAFDLYGELARRNPGDGTFFSPYSLSVALAMTAEGARGETAEQMARALHFSEAARRAGDDAQAIPFNVALIHTGYAALNKRWNRAGEGDRAARQQIEKLRKELADANNQAAALRKAKKDDESNKFALKSQEVAGRLNALLVKVDQFELRTANALWGEQTYPFRPAFTDTIHRYYNTGGIFSVDFRNKYEAVRQQINAWSSEQTNQKIPELIGRNVLSPEDGKRVRLILTNAIYFKGEWSTVFSEGATKDGDFLLAGGGKSRVPLMHHGYLGAGYAAFNGDGTPFNTPREVPLDGEQPPVYPGDDGFAMLELSYKGDELSMVLIAPRSPDGLPAVEKLLTAEHWPDFVKALAGRPVDTYVPRFKLDQSFELSEPMKALGMVRPFEMPGPNGAEFDGMCASDDPDLRLFIAKVLHSARVEVTEKGTEAAAATAVITALPPSARPLTVPFTPQFRADRPFVFLIRDKQTGTILFMGRVTQPSRA